MKKRTVTDTDYQKLIIYPEDVDPQKMKELMELFTKMKIPLSYEAY